MSFSDHTYGGAAFGSENGVIQILHCFLHKVGADETYEAEPPQCDQRNFIDALEKLIHTLQRSLQELQANWKSRQMARSPSPSCNSEYDATVPEVDPELIQVRADNEEIQRRIDAFLERKQKEVDDMNKREFSSSYGPNVSRVVNRYGPQTSDLTADSAYDKSSSRPGLAGVTGDEKPGATTVGANIEERISNMEEHLRLDPGNGRGRSEMFERIKKLEERILVLESISPEYVTAFSFPTKRARTEVEGNCVDSSHYQEMTLAEINNRIAIIRRQLKDEASKFT